MTTKQLYNSLVDYLLVIGYDQDTGLTPLGIENQSNSTDIFTTNFEPSILASINNEAATYPRRSIKTSLLYPPIKLLKSTSIIIDNEADILPEINPKKLNRRDTKVYQKSFTPEVIDNMPQFCFPDNTFISRKNAEPKIHSFVLTDIEGNKTFAISLNYYRDFYCCIHKGETITYELIKIDEEEDFTEDQNDYLLVYIPTAILLLSKYSYFSVLKTYLSCIYESLSNNPNDFNSIIENYAYELTNLPIPPISTQRVDIILEIDLLDNKVSLLPQDEFLDNVFDLNLSILFMKFDVDMVLKIILSILTEQKLVFISKNYGLLTPIIECVLRILYPFKWQPTYVPVLPSAKIDFIEAPNVFIMGCNSIYRDQIEKTQEIVLVDIDNGTVNIPEEIKLENFPSRCLEWFKPRFAQIDIHLLETKKLTGVSPLNFKTYINVEQSTNQQLNLQLSNLFLEFYAHIFGDIYSFMKLQPKSFNKKKYLESQTEQELPFYEAILRILHDDTRNQYAQKIQVAGTYIFDLFINERINFYSLEINDPYFRIIEQVKLISSYNFQNANKSPQLTNEINEIEKAKQDSYNRSTKKAVRLPSFDENFLANCIQLFTEELESSKSLIYKDYLHYLRGFFNIAIGKVMDGFSDFYAINSSTVFPKKMLQNVIIPNLTQQQKEDIFEQDFYKNGQEFKKFGDKDELLTSCLVESTAEDSDYVQFNDLSITQFSEKLEQLDIRIDSDTAIRLFQALTLESESISNKLDVFTFELFVDYWFLKQEELMKINKYLPNSKSRNKEFALKISNQSVKTSEGIGRIVLTQKCLYYLEEGTKKRTTLLELKDIKSIDKFQSNEIVFSAGKPALKIVTKNNDTIELCLLEERNIWYLLIKEIWSAICLSEATKDTSIIQYAAKNALLLNAVISSGHDDRSYHSEDLNSAAEYLCYYTSLLDGKDSDLLADTSHILHLRINVSNREFEKHSVESMIYVCVDDYSTLWCAVNNRIKIFDSVAWIYETADIKLNEKITCLAHVTSQSKVWIGSLDKCIYVVDYMTRSLDKKLVSHTDVIVTLCYSQQLSIVASATKSGEIILWNSDKMEFVKTIELKSVLSDFNRNLISLYSFNDKFILTTSSQVDVLSRDFQFENSFIMQNNEKPLSISCSCISTLDNNNLIWVGCSTLGFIWVWNLADNELMMRLAVDDLLGFRALLFANDTVWAGSKDGKLEIFNVKTFEHERSLNAHKDTIRSLCLIGDKFTVSGSGSRDGCIAIWKASNIKSKKSIISSIEKFRDREPTDLRKLSMPYRRRSGLAKKVEIE